MDSCQLEWRRSTKKDLRRIAPEDRPKIIAGAEALVLDPFPTGSTKLVGSEHSYRIRIGN